MKNTRGRSRALIKVVTNRGDSTVNTAENSISELAAGEGTVCAGSPTGGGGLATCGSQTHSGECYL